MIVGEKPSLAPMGFRPQAPTELGEDALTRGQLSLVQMVKYKLLQQDHLHIRKLQSSSAYGSADPSPK